MNVYECLVIECWESWNISIHKTASGAFKAGNQWLNDQHNQSFESRASIGKSSNDFMGKHHRFKVVKKHLLD